MKFSWKYPGKFGKRSAKMFQIGNPLSVPLLSFFFYFVTLFPSSYVSQFDCALGHHTSRGPFLESPENLRVFFRVPQFFFISSQRQSFKPSNFAVLLVLRTLKASSKISSLNQADCILTTGFSGPKSSRDFRATRPRIARS